MYVEHLHLSRSLAFFRSTGSRQAHDLHVHDCLEIGVVLKNELIYRFGNETYHGKPGDAFLCRPFDPHWSYSVAEEPFESIIILFTPEITRKLPDGSRLVSPFYANRRMHPLIPAASKYAKEIKAAASRGMKAQEQKASAWQTLQYSCLIEILVQILEWVEDRSDMNEETGLDAVEAVNWMLDHFERPLDVKALANRSGMGRSLFFEEFKKLTGLSPRLFLNRLRIQYAMDALRTTHQSVLKTAEESGFQSLSTFNKQFKWHTGLSPREYRKIRS